MQTIQAVRGFPNKTPIDAIQLKIVKAFERNETTGGAYGPSSVQNAFGADASGQEIKIKIWGHPDVQPLVGKEVVIHQNGKGKGVQVSVDTYKGKNEAMIEVSKVGQFQLIEVYHAGNPSNNASDSKPGSGYTQGQQSASSAKVTASVHGQTVGMAINNAVAILGPSAVDLARDGKLENAIVTIGSKIIKASMRLESGEGSIKQAEVAKGEPQARIAQPAQAAISKPKDEASEEDVPF